LSVCRRTTSKGTRITLLRSAIDDHGTIQAELYLCLLKYITWYVLSVDIIWSERQVSQFVRLAPKRNYGRHWMIVCFHKRTSPKAVDKRKIRVWPSRIQPKSHGNERNWLA